MNDNYWLVGVFAQGAARVMHVPIGESTLGVRVFGTRSMELKKDEVRFVVSKGLQFEQVDGPTVPKIQTFRTIVMIYYF